MATLTQHQLDAELRMQQSLDSLWSWIEELDEKEDGQLLNIAQGKISILLKKLDRKIQQAHICTNCGHKAEKPLYECPSCGWEFTIG